VPLPETILFDFRVFLKDQPLQEEQETMRSKHSNIQKNKQPELDVTSSDSL